jgi:ribosomal protein S25
VRDRRVLSERQALVRRIVGEVLSRRALTLDAVDCARVFGISTAICHRILKELENAGVVLEARPGIWMRSTFA